MPTGAQLLLEALKAHGVDTIFGIPGIHNLAIYDALVGEPAVRVVTTRDERGAGHMADGYARATGRRGVCLTVPGPGVTNALTAIGEAYYYNTAQTSNPAAMSALSKVVPISQIVFGTDFPFRNAAEHVKGLKDCGVFSPTDLQAIDRLNALRLLPKFSA